MNKIKFEVGDIVYNSSSDYHRHIRYHIYEIGLSNYRAYYMANGGKKIKTFFSIINQHLFSLIPELELKRDFDNET